MDTHLVRWLDRDKHNIYCRFKDFFSDKPYSEHLYFNFRIGFNDWKFLVYTGDHVHIYCPPHNPFKVLFLKEGTWFESNMWPDVLDAVDDYFNTIYAHGLIEEHGVDPTGG